MNVAISVVRPFHVVKMANALRKHVSAVDIWSTAHRRYYHHLESNVGLPLRLTSEASCGGTSWWAR